jgi:S-DNA-T family DNA segregation ATPase FtsK/SpoIIIE
MPANNVFVLPREPNPPKQSQTPWLAALMPLVMSMTLFLVTQSPISLALALLSPVALGINRFAYRRAERKRHARETLEFACAIDQLHNEVSLFHESERVGWVRQHPTALLIGYAPRPSAAQVSGASDTASLRGLTRQIRENPAMPVALGNPQDPTATSALSLSFDGVLARQLSQRAKQRGREVHREGHDAQQGENSAELRIDRYEGTLTLESGQTISLHIEPSLRHLAEQREQLTDRVIQQNVGRSSLSALLGHTADGTPIMIDLVHDGPHALIAGTTGSGKSELLQTLLWQLARGHSTSQVQFLLLDFKGGTSLQYLAKLPHALDLLTDLEHEQVQRTVSGLTSELRRREQLLRSHEVNDIAELPESVNLARVIIAVDEFATLLHELPALHEIFIDIAARGRSLGLHLVIATQRPGGVVRDALAANCSLRFCLRVANTQESHAVLGSDAAMRLDPNMAGACLHQARGETSRSWRVTQTLRQDIEASAQMNDTQAVRPWFPALPSRVVIESWPPCPEGAAYLGLCDIPDEQVQHPIAWDAKHHGTLLVLGARASGKTNTADLIASQWLQRSPHHTVWFADGNAELVWEQLNRALTELEGETTQASPTLWVFDDVDSAIEHLSPEHASQAVHLLSRMVRELPNQHNIILTLTRIPGQLSAMLSTLTSRVLLRAANREQHIVWGLPPSTFSPSVPAGRATFGDVTVQIAQAASAVKRTTLRDEPLPDHPVLAVITPRARFWRQRAARSWPDAEFISLAEGGVDSAAARQIIHGSVKVVCVGDGDDWLGNSSLSTELRHRALWVFDGCTHTEIRQIIRKSTLPPPLMRANTALTWQSQDGFRRVRLARHPEP